MRPSGSRFNADYLVELGLRGQQLHAALLHHQDAALLQQAHVPEGRACPVRRRASTQLIDAAQKMTRGEASGFLTLNFDWLYWPLFAMNGIDLLSKDLTKPTFNTPKAIEVTDRLAKATESGRDQQDLLDGTLGRAERRLRRRQRRHAARPFARLLLRQGAGQVGHARDAGRRARAGRLRHAQLARPRHLQGLQEPRARLGLPQVRHQRGRASELGVNRKLVTGNVAVDTKNLADAREERSARLLHPQDAARAYRQDGRQLAPAATTAGSRKPSGRSCRTCCSAARMPRPRWPMPSARSPAS